MPGSYYLRGPEKREPGIPPVRYVAPTPTPPSLPVTITGEVRLEGIPLDSVLVTVSGVGSVTADSFGTYVGTVPYGYSGNTALVGYNPPVYTIAPSTRNYAVLTGNQAGQDFDIDINYLVISGTVTSSGSGVSVELVNTYGTLTTAASGSYGYYVPYAWSGSTVPVTAGSFWPADYVYGPVGIDHPNQNFEVTVFVPPVLPSMSWTLHGPYSDFSIANGATIDDAYMTSNLGKTWALYGPTISLILNEGASSITVSSVSISSADFSMTLLKEDLFTPFVPPDIITSSAGFPADRFNIMLTIAGAPGAKSAVVTIVHNGSNSPFIANLQGTL